MLFVLLCNLSDENRDLVEKIFRENKNKFYNIAYSYLKSDASAKDAVSESMIKIIKNIHKLVQLSCPQLNAFCVTIVKNTCIDLLRKEKKVLVLDDNELQQKVNEVNYHEPTNHHFDDLLIAVKKLSEEERKFIYLRFGLDKTFKEIAIILNISEDAAKKRGQRTLTKLKKMLESEMIE